MKIKFFSVCFFLVFLMVMEVRAQEQKPLPQGFTLFEGKVVGAEMGAPVSGVHVFNLHRDYVAVSKEDGVFNLPVKAGDTLKFTSVGYETLLVPLQQDFQKQGQQLVILQPKVYELEEVVVNPFPSERELKQQILEAELPEEENKVDLALDQVEYHSPQDPNEGPKMAISGPISGLVNAFSGKAKARRKLQENKVEDKRRAYIDSRYNKEVVMEVTGLEEGEKLDAFMNSCTISDGFITDASEYELYDAILSCYKNFESQFKG